MGQDNSRLTAQSNATVLARRTGIVTGIALMGAVDEILFHQLLQWHTFYIHVGPFWRTFSDGLFHLFTASLWFSAVLLLWYQRRRIGQVLSDRLFWSAILLGMGAFQVFDGVVNHKVLGLHPVREGVTADLPYDVGWIASGVLFLFAGAYLRRSRNNG